MGKTPAKEESIYWMENIPDHTNVMIKKAEHVAFVGNPEDFHKEILRFLSTQCQLGEDTDIEDDLDFYDNEDYFGYGGYGYDTESDSDYYGDSDYQADNGGDNADYEKYLYDYFNGDSDYDGEYYDDKDLTEDELAADTEDDEYDRYGQDSDQMEDLSYRRRNVRRRRRRI